MNKRNPSGGDQRGSRMPGVGEGKHIPPLTLLSDFLAEPDEPLNYRVDQLMPVGSTVLLSAPGKAGKSVLAQNLIRSLVDGDDFLGEYEATPATGRVVLLDAELDERRLRRWLRHQKIRNGDRVAVRSLRGRTSSFNILDPDVREEWVERLREMEASVVILDCLRPVLDSIGLDEDKDAGKFLVAFDELLQEAGVEEAIVVHHMGHQGERARGSSRLIDWPDVGWKYLIGKDGLRFLQAFGRDVDFPETALGFEKTTRHLTVVGGTRVERVEAAEAETLIPVIVELLTEDPGLSFRKIEKVLAEDGPYQQKPVRAALNKSKEQGLVTVTKQGGAHLHYVAEAVRQSASEPRQRGSAECVSASLGTHTHAHPQTGPASEEEVDAHTGEDQPPDKSKKTVRITRTKPKTLPEPSQSDDLGKSKPRLIDDEDDEERWTF